MSNTAVWTLSVWCSPSLCSYPLNTQESRQSLPWPHQATISMQIYSHVISKNVLSLLIPREPGETFLRYSLKSRPISREASTPPYHWDLHLQSSQPFLFSPLRLDISEVVPYWGAQGKDLNLQPCCLSFPRSQGYKPVPPVCVLFPWVWFPTPTSDSAQLPGTPAWGSNALWENPYTPGISSLGHIHKNKNKYLI